MTDEAGTMAAILFPFRFLRAVGIVILAAFLLAPEAIGMILRRRP
jgi:hypothetical protein